MGQPGAMTGGRARRTCRPRLDACPEACGGSGGLAGGAIPRSVPGPRCPTAFPWTSVTWFGPCGSQASWARRRVTRNMNSVWDTPTLCCLTLCLRCSTKGVSSSIATHSTCPLLSFLRLCRGVPSKPFQAGAGEHWALVSAALPGHFWTSWGALCTPNKGAQVSWCTLPVSQGIGPGPHCGLGLPPGGEGALRRVLCAWVPVGGWQRLWGTLLPPTHRETWGMIACEGKADLGGLACRA